MDGFDAVLKGQRAYVSSTYDPAEKGKVTKKKLPTNKTITIGELLNR